MTTEDPIRSLDLLPGDYQNDSSGENDDALLATTVPNAALAALRKTISSTVLNQTLASAEGHASVVTHLIEANEAEGTEEGDDRSESSETSSDAPRRNSSAIERARSANQSPFKSALRNSTSKAVIEGRTGQGDDSVILTCDLYVKKTGLTNTRYAKHFCTLSYAEGVDGGCRLSYQESRCIVREIAIVGMDDEVAARLEFTIISDEDQTYSVRAFLRAEFEQWTDAIKKIVPPPLSSRESEGSEPKETSSRLSSLSRKSSTAGTTSTVVAEGGVCVLACGAV